MYLRFLLIIFLALNACHNTPTQDQQQSSTQQDTSAVQTIRPYQKALTKEYASFRDRTISNVEYVLDVHLIKQSQQFSATTEIAFDWHDKSQSPVTLDFESGTVNKVEINGKQVTAAYSKWFISLPPTALKRGRNKVIVHYTRAYSKNGSGLHRYDDTETGNTYLYTQFEPYDANLMFPLFDQPSIKARFTLTVNAPAHWHVISSVMESKTETIGEQKRWYFPQSAKYSSYIFSLHAGPFHIWEDSFQQGQQQNNIPLRLFARQELKHFVKPEDWFTATKQSLAFFNHYFDFAYPFVKYDQLIVPDYNFGAMENVAAVTFTERYLSRGQKTEALKFALSNTIAHELAHMWFGNIVTMQWWDDLWLNESFATYMANLALHRTHQHKNVWDTFYSGTKQWAYKEDSLVTTHPIVVPVPSTANVISNIDGITYGKGASVLKQLPYLLGEEVFRHGVVEYIKQNAYQNATLDDFITSLAAAARRDMSLWTKEWLQQPGVNTIEARFSCDKGRLTSLDIMQTAPTNWPTLRSQKIQIALYRYNSVSGEMEQQGIISALYSGESTPINLNNNFHCPELVYPNYDDWAYVKVKFDPISLATLNSHINDFSELGLRLALWQSLWDSVENTELAISDYANFIMAKLGDETNKKIIRKVVKEAVALHRYFDLFSFRYSSIQNQNTSVAKRYKNMLNTQKKLADFLWLQFQQAEEKSDNKRIYLAGFIELARSHEQLENLHGLLHKNIEEVGLKIDQDLRWDIIIQLNRFPENASGWNIDWLIEQETKRDKSDRGDIASQVARAIRPELKIKQYWFDQLSQHSNKHKFALQREIMAYLFQSEQMQLKQAVTKNYFSVLSELAEVGNDMYLEYYSQSFNPNSCLERSGELIAQEIKKQPKIKPVLLDSLKVSKQKLQRCIDLYKLENLTD